MGRKGKPKAGGESAAVALAPDRDYFVYWSAGGKSVCAGGRLAAALDFYLSRARRIVDVLTRDVVWQRG